MDTQCLRKRGLNPAGGVTVFKCVAVRTGRFSSPGIFPNSCLECTNAFIMAQGDICSFVHGFVRAERSSEYLAIPMDHYIQIGPSLLIFLSTQNLSLGQLTSKWMSAGR